MTRTRVLAWAILAYEVIATLVMAYEVVAYSFGAIERRDFVLFPSALTAWWLVRQGVALALGVCLVGYLLGVRFLSYGACYLALFLGVLQANEALRDFAWDSVTVPISAILYVLLAVWLQRELALTSLVSRREPKLNRLGRR